MTRPCALVAIAALLCAAVVIAQDHPVATIDLEPVRHSDLVRHLLRENWSTATQALTQGAVLEIELKKAGITLTNEEIEEEQNSILQRLAPGQTAAQVMATGAFSPVEMRRQAWLSRGWDRIFIAENKIQAQNTADNTNQILKQLFIRRKLEQYEIRVRGVDLEPVPRLIAWIKAKDGTGSRAITEDDALQFLMGSMKPWSLQRAIEELVESRLVDRELARAEKTVTETEVEAWSRSMQEKYRPPFDWRMICQFKGTTPDQEGERWRHVQAWKRITGREADPDEIKAFVARNVDQFSGQTRLGEIRHILIMAVNPITGLAPAAEDDAKAQQRIETLAEKLREGVDFAWLAERYSEDRTSAKAGGLLSMPIATLGGGWKGLDPAFQDAAWRLKPGDVSPPVRSKFGWHLIKRDVVRPEKQIERDFQTPDYRDWIVDEFETIKMTEWLGGVRSRAKIVILPR